MIFDRPATLQKIQAGIDGQGKLSSWSQKVIASSIAKILNPGMIKDGIDQYLVWGINDTAYSFPNLHVEVVALDSPIPVGVWRSVQNGPMPLSSNPSLMNWLMQPGETLSNSGWNC